MELKPCPFCGGKASIVEATERQDVFVEEAFIQCEWCGFSIHHKWLSVETLIEYWNNRYERTCKPETEVLDTVDIGIGFLERLVDNCSDCGEPLTCDYSLNTPWRRVLPNYCPNCGAKVVE